MCAFLGKVDLISLFVYELICQNSFLSFEQCNHNAQSDIVYV